MMRASRPARNGKKQNSSLVTPCPIPRPTTPNQPWASTPNRPLPITPKQLSDSEPNRPLPWQGRLPLRPSQSWATSGGCGVRVIG